jgi:hypothetical protein
MKILIGLLVGFILVKIAFTEIMFLLWLHDLKGVD